MEKYELEITIINFGIARVVVVTGEARVDELSPKLQL